MKARIYSASCLSLLCAASLLVGVLCANKAAAQQPPYGAARQTKIGVIDVKYILENHVRFKQTMDQLKTQYQAVATQLEQERQQIINKQKELAAMKPGTPDYNNIDEQILRLKADLQIKFEKQKKEIRNQESHILWNVYQEISRATEQYCQQNQYGLVIQFNGEKIDGTKPQDVFQQITKPIVYNAPHLDITPYILQALNGPQGGAGRPAVGTRPRQSVPLK